MDRRVDSQPDWQVSATLRIKKTFNAAASIKNGAKSIASDAM
jgi:hypothetical protein